MTLRTWREAVRDDEALDASSKLVAFLLSTFAEADGKTAAPGHEELGRVAGRGKMTVYRAVVKLKDRGYIREIHKGHGAGPFCGACGVNNIYELVQS